MKIRCKKEQLLNILNASVGILERKNTTPLLNYLYLQCEIDGKTTTKATNYEISLYNEYHLDVIDPGSILVPCKNLLEIAKELPDEKEIDMTITENNRIQIECGSIIFKIIGVEASQFPTFPEIRGEFFRMSTSTLKMMIDRVLFAASVDNNRYNINGIYIEKKKNDERNTIRMVATDGHRLSMIDTEVIDWENISLSKGVIMHRRGVQELRKMIENQHGDIEISFLDNQMVAKCGSSKIFIRLVEGDFPEYEMVIPKKNTKHIRVNRLILMNAIKRISILPNLYTTQKMKAVQFIVKNNILCLYSQQSEVGEASEDVPIEYQGEEITIGFNGKYFNDILSVCNCANVRIKLADGLTAGIIEDEDVSGHKNVIMPIRI